MIEYKVIKCDDMSELEKQINFMMSSGWHPTGGVFVYTEKLNKVWCQAMVFK